MILKEIDLGDSTIEGKRELVLTYNGRKVIIEDEHHRWHYGVLDYKGDDLLYEISINNPEPKRLKLHFHDLKTLLITHE